MITDENCRKIELGQRPLTGSESGELSREVPQWALRDSSISRELSFKGFREAIGFVNEVAVVAEAQDHHPDICISYNKVDLRLTTHKAGGLTRNDFIMAAKIDAIEASK